MGGVAVAQSVRTWLGNRRVAGSSPTRTKRKVWTGSWRGASSPPGHCRGALEQGTEPPQLLRAPVHGQPPHSDISPFNACIGPVCACVCVRTCVYLTTECKP